uniref:Uncharacterized protein n=1 Tax=Aplanochytrium stocchinoi TaxID=215587 RepID=A0A7S3LLK6_9STRA
MSVPYRPRILEAKNAEGNLPRYKLGPKLKTGKDSVPDGGSDADVSLRTCCLKSGPISKASGSAYVEFGNTKVIASVFGPHAKRFGRANSDFTLGSGSLNCEVRFAPFARSDDSGDTERDAEGVGMTPEEHWLTENLVQSLAASIQLHRFPKSVLDVNVYILEDDGSAQAVATTCASLALVDSGVELYDIVAGCNVADCDGRLVVDPNKQQLDTADGYVSMALMPNHSKLTQFEVNGSFSVSRLGEVSSLGYNGCSTVARIMRDEAISAGRKHWA